ncbi:sulfotransferase family protein [Limibaculum sp. FT325]|uniref:sulfotransferase family 2 domain-containing protein n=1 Tax=Thermohalobaculum sediminis TaxID=2939436 RepID=UPI0020BED858|nr:sulfotransferase family 2 domain-containing protein [Limibaculum sediminis]MCL5779298.1 sulfotransferase family protein [Limibaculum sediminis]
MVSASIHRDQLRRGTFESNIINRNAGFAYLSIPKAANSSIKYALLPTVGLADDSEINGVKAIRLIHDQSSGPFSFERKAQIIADLPPLIFTCVRNTWARLLSCYQDKVRKTLHGPFSIYGITSDYSFEDFLEIIAKVPDELAEIHFRSQLSLIHHEGRFLPNLVLRAENLHKEWPILQSYFRSQNGIEISDLRILNRTANENRVTISRRAIEIISTRYKDEIKFFGFSPPEQ